MNFTPQQEQLLKEYFDEFYERAREIQVTAKVTKLALLAQMDSDAAAEVDFSKEDLIRELDIIIKHINFITTESAELNVNPSYMFWRDKNQYNCNGKFMMQ